MTDKKAKQLAIKWMIQQKYYSVQDKTAARNYAIEDLKKLQEEYSWPCMKKALLHVACRNIGEFRKLALHYKNN